MGTLKMYAACKANFNSKKSGPMRLVKPLIGETVERVNDKKAGRFNVGKILINFRSGCFSWQSALPYIEGGLRGI